MKDSSLVLSFVMAFVRVMHVFHVENGINSRFHFLNMFSKRLYNDLDDKLPDKSPANYIG